MALHIDIKVRRTYTHGDEWSSEVEAFSDGVKLFAPGATIIVDRHYGSQDLVVNVKWASSSSSGTFQDAQIQSEVMKVALKHAQAATKAIAATIK